MPYSGSPATSATDRVRLYCGDIWDDMEYLTDADYQFYIDRMNGNENRASLECMRAILFKLSRGAREKTGDIEVFGSEYFKNYLAALTLVLKNPEAVISLAVPYAGGISKKDMLTNDLNPDSPTRSIYIGVSDHRKLYNQHNPGPQYNGFGDGIFGWGEGGFDGIYY
jgi:hypothetical protein